MARTAPSGRPHAVRRSSLFARSAEEAACDGADEAMYEGAGDTESLAEKTLRLAAERQHAHRGGDELATQRQHARGKLTARERIDLLLDPGTFNELETFRRHQATGFGMEHRRPYTDGVVTGWGTVFGRKIFVYAHDFRIFGGSLGSTHAAKIHKLMDIALDVGAPIVGLNDGTGARIQEGVNGLAGYGGIFRRNVLGSGVVPQVSVMLGPCAGGAAYSPALTDFVFMVSGTSHMFLTGPDVIKAVTGEAITGEQQQYETEPKKEQEHGRIAQFGHVGSLVDGGWPEIMRRNHELALRARDLICSRLDIPHPAPDEMIGVDGRLPDARRRLR